MDVLGLILIFCARILDVSCGTVRILFIVRGKRAMAAAIGFLEVMVYLTALGRVLGGGREMTLIQMIVYCSGFSAGNYIGSLLEEKLLNAYVMVELIMDRTPETNEMIEQINREGTTILLVEQNAKKALSIANRAYVLETGEITKSGSGIELLHDDAVRKAYLGG